MASFTFASLTPTSFLVRSALVFADRVAVVDGELRLTYAAMLDRSRRLSGALAALGVGRGDRVAALCTNSHVMLEMHHGVPMLGAVLVPLNIRLSPDELAWIVEHSGARVLVATEELAGVARDVCARTGARLVLDVGEGGEYDELLRSAHPREPEVVDEKDLLAINYTSGTTGSPKGVMYHHRGAFLQSLAMAFHTRLDSDSRYLWTLPMFHCDGWSFPWAVTAAGGTHVCLRAIDPAQVWRLLREEGVTHFSAAPTVLSMIANAPEADGTALTGPVAVTTGGAPPTPTLLTRMAELGMDVTHLYGLTETFGPVAVNEWRTEWDELSGEERSTLRARQGVGNVIAPPLRVIDPAGRDVPSDGETIGEIAARGNAVMTGYYRDEAATDAVDAGGWFRTGDLAVMHPDGYVEIRDRSKDIIISGGENISSVEVERVIASHPDVVECAVVARPDDQWGEVPVAFVVLRDGAVPDRDAIVAHVRGRLAGFKAPKDIVFGDLPKTSTGKIQKNVLRRGLNPDGPSGTPPRAGRPRRSGSAASPGRTRPGARGSGAL